MINPKPAKSTNDVRAILYDAGGHDQDVELDTVDIESLGKRQLLWVDQTGSMAVKLPEPMRSALGSPDDGGSLEIFDQFYRFCIPTLDLDGSCLRFAVGNSWVLTASERRPKFFDEFLEAD